MSINKFQPQFRRYIPRDPADDIQVWNMEIRHVQRIDDSSYNKVLTYKIGTQTFDNYEKALKYLLAFKVKEDETLEMNVIETQADESLV